MKGDKIMEYTIKRNEAFNSLEITFDGKPSEAVRDALKALRFRWHKVKGLWYGYASEDAVKAAIEGKAAEAAPAPAKAEKPAKAAEKVNKYGVKVGDLFHASWGYDQTNNDFFQVVALVGEQSVRVREVYPVCEEAEATCWAAEDRVFSTNTRGVLLPAAKSSVFIKDQERGDLKRIQVSKYGNQEDVYFRLDSFAFAHKCEGETTKVYESWYA